MTSRTLISWLAVFVFGFLAGVVFSAWKLEVSTAPVRQPPHAVEQPGVAESELKARISGLEKMLAVRPNDTDVLIQLGNDYFDIGNHEKAAEYYRRSLEVNPSNADVWTDLGISQRKLGKSQESADAFRKALEVDPNHPMALFNLGIILRDDLKDYPGALKAWETYLEKAGDSPHAVMVRPWVSQLKERLKSQEQQ